MELTITIPEQLLGSEIRYSVFMQSLNGHFSFNGVVGIKEEYKPTDDTKTPEQQHKKRIRNTHFLSYEDAKEAIRNQVPEKCRTGSGVLWGYLREHPIEGIPNSAAYAYQYYKKAGTWISYMDFIGSDKIVKEPKPKAIRVNIPKEERESKNKFITRQRLNEIFEERGWASPHAFKLPKNEAELNDLLRVVKEAKEVSAN